MYLLPCTARGIVWLRVGLVANLSRATPTRTRFNDKCTAYHIHKGLVLNWDQTWARFVREKPTAMRKQRDAVSQALVKKLPKSQRAMILRVNGQPIEQPTGKTFKIRKRLTRDEDYRHDPVKNGRKGITAAPSIWYDATRGPLTLSVPDAMLSHKYITTFNQKYEGRAYIVKSGGKSHFMSGETTVETWRNLFMPAYKVQRKRLGVGIDTKGGMHCDAFTGNFASNDGLAERRSAVLQEINVMPPDREEGGWSAKGQSVDKVHIMFVDVLPSSVS